MHKPKKYKVPNKPPNLISNYESQKKKKIHLSKIFNINQRFNCKNKNKKKKHEIQQTKTIHYRNSLIKQNSNYESKKLKIKKHIFQRFSTFISALTEKKKSHEIQQTKTIHAHWINKIHKRSID